MDQAFPSQRCNDAYLNRALYQLRAVIIRDEGNGLDHVEALLRLRGCDPGAYRVRQKAPRQFKRGELTRLIVSELQSGPKRTAEICEGIAAKRPGVCRKRLYASVSVALTKLARKGRLVDVRRGVWCGRRHTGWQKSE